MSPQALPEQHVENDLLGLLRKFVSELHPGTFPKTIAFGSSLQDDLGIDSLARAELITRIEQRFGIRLRDSQIVSAESVGDLIGEIEIALRIATRSAAPASASPGPGLRLPIRIPGSPLSVRPLPDDAKTLADVLEVRALEDSSRVYVTFYPENGGKEELSYGKLYSKAKEVASALRKFDLSAKPTVALMLPTCLEFLYCFYGIILAGGIPVPLYPPDRPNRLEEHLRRQMKILANSRASLLIAPREARLFRSILRPMLPQLQEIVRPDELLGDDRQFERVLLHRDDTGFLQYTSGSTGDLRRGVILTHGNLLANIRAIGEVIRPSASDRFVSWLPLYHDMGLIGACMGTLYFGVELVLMSPIRFITRPERWLWAIHEHRATLSAAPNFAYELCARKIGDAALEGLDLSSWRAAFNGAEPVAAVTFQRFSERFKNHGFRPEALTPLYGLAESSVGLTFPPLGRGPRVERVSRTAMLDQGRALPSDTADALSMVSCGSPLPRHEIRIVGGAGHELPEREVGRIQFRGPSSTRGYFANPEATRQLFDKDWLQTGDYGYVADGELYVTGRAKDMIIRGGRHLFPYEIENQIGDLPGIRKGGVAVFGRQDEASGTEQIIVLAETRSAPGDAGPEVPKIREKIRRIVLDAAGFAPDDVMLLPPHSVLKTPSGKTRRPECLKLYEHRTLGKTKAPWLQWIDLRLSSLVPASRRSFRRAALFLYGCYFWLLSALCTPALAAGVLLLPRLSWRISFSRRLLRCLFFLCGISLEIDGAENIDPEKTQVIVVNHASYLDAPILFCVVPGIFRFAAKRELRRKLVVGLMLRRMKCLFVERFEQRSASESALLITQSLRKGQTMALFPEGTFTRSPGLRPFRMGAFLSAAKTGTRVVPITLRGTRSILRDGRKLPSPGRVTVVVSRPLQPERADWQEAIRLRDATRAEMLRHCGEPDLGQ